MRVMVALENRFYKNPDGQIYSSTGCDYNFWKRYLQSFDEVVVFARVGHSDHLIVNKCPATGPGVTFLELPMYIGPRQYLHQRKKIRQLAKNAVEQADVFILRIPGTIGTILWKQLRETGIPYGVEVVGSSYDSLKTANINPVIESLLYLWQLIIRSQRRQCAWASAAAYVTQQYLQNIYPPGGWSTYYSTIDLNKDCFATDAELAARARLLEKAISGQRPFLICHAASMDARYKAQDVLIRAVAACRRKGVNAEIVFLGDGKYQSYYESVARREGIDPHVNFLGRITSGKPVQEQMDRADLFVFPSLTEGLPKGVIEAMARGLPCLASSVGGIPELLEDEFLVPAGNMEALTQKLSGLLRAPGCLLEASRRNRLKAKEYAASELNPRRMAFYQKLTEMTQKLRCDYNKSAIAARKGLSMDLKNYVVCKNVLGIQTNSKYIGWSFGQITQPAEQEELEKCKVVVRLVVEDLQEEMKDFDTLQKYHYWAGDTDRKKLYYQRNFLLGTKLRMVISDAFGSRPEIRVNKNFLKHIKWRFNNLHSPGYILTDLICTLLLQRDMCALHCSAFSVGGKTVLVIAPPDTGKTLTTMRAVFDYGASYISEDLAITDGQKIYACPWTSTFRYYDELSMSRVMALRMKLIKILPIVEILPFPGQVKTIDEYIGRERIVEVAPVTHLAILARREGGLKILAKEEALRMVYNLNRYEFFYRKSPMLTAYTYFNHGVDIDVLANKEKMILNNLVNQSQCLLVQNRDPRQFAKQIVEAVSQS